jgi:hypothetical protein
MSLPLAIAAIVLGDLALIAVLAFVMSRAHLLRPHTPRALLKAETELRRDAEMLHDARGRAGGHARARDHARSSQKPAVPART